MNQSAVTQYAITIELWHIIVIIASLLTTVVTVVWTVFRFLDNKREKHQNKIEAKKDKDRDRRFSLWEERVKANDKAHAAFLLEQHALQERVSTLEASIPRWEHMDKAIQSLREKMDTDTNIITDRIHSFTLEMIKIITDNKDKKT